MLFFLGVLILVIWAISSRGNDRKQKAELSRRNQEWVDFIAGYARVVHSAKEKALVRRMLDDIATQQLGRPSVPVEPATPPDPLPQGVAVPEMPSMPLQAAAVAIKPKATVQLDNASLLLYFGAFLFVAAAGLFVAFGGANGVVRTCIVLLVSLALYGGGIWLHRNRPKLKQAGQAFAGIGIVLAPLVGSALYVYVFNRSQGMLVWFMTSLLCLVMYAHALLVFRTALIGYVLVFTLLSLFESGVGVVHAPLYYYGWCLAAVGIGLQLVSRLRGGMAIVQETSSRSAMVLLPVSIVVSVAMVPEQGATQLGVSLLLAAAFYGLEALGTKDSEQEASAVISQLAAVCGVAALVYGVSGRWYTTAVSLLTVNALQLAVMGFHKTGGKLWRNYASVLLAVSLASTLAAAPYHVLLLTDIAAALLIAAVIWLLQRREDAYGLAGLYWLALPYVAGQLTFGPLTAAGQTAAGFAAAVLLLAVYIAQSAQIRASLQWRTVAAGTYMIGMSAVLVTSLFAAPVVTLVAAVALAGTCMVLIKSDHNKDWADAAGVIMMVPLLHSWDSRGIFLLSTLVALSGLVVLSIRFRRENLRWASTLVWLLLPVSLGHAQVGGHWSPTVYAWAYLLAMVGLVISRAVARGVLYLSSTVPMSSYARNASLSYVFGYGASAVLACLISLASPDSRFHATAILAITGITAYVLSRYIEKRSDILVFLPVIAQAVLLSAIHPAHHAPAAVFYGLAGTVVAVLVYRVFEVQSRLQTGDRQKGLQSVMQVSVAAAFVGPFSFMLGVKPNWATALGLLAAGALLQYHIRAGKQDDRELAGSIIVLGIWWLMFFAHVHATQAYIHVVVATLALYAWWRYKRGERVQSDQYIWWTLGVATVPLALQALSGTGGLYGWWLLLEQIVIMLVGMSIERRFVVRWGLYVAVGAVLYQLRGLGYAALAFLALFLIGLAVYKLQKYNDQK